MTKGTIVNNIKDVIVVLCDQNGILNYPDFGFDPQKNYEIFKDGFGGFEALYEKIVPLTSLFRQTIESCLELDPDRDKIFLKALSRDLRRILLLAKDITAKLSGNKDLKSPGLSINLMSAYFSFCNNISDFSSYTGIAISYKTENDKAGQRSNKLPIELDTPEAQKYLSRAVAAGMMEITDTGAKWKTAVTRLGYLCSKIYQQPRPIAALEKYFGVSKLSTSITNASLPATRSDVKKWRAEIDTKIFYD